MKCKYNKQEIKLSETENCGTMTNELEKSRKGGKIKIK